MFNPADIQGDFRIVQNNYAFNVQAQQRIATANPNRVILYVSAYGAQGWQFWLGSGLQLAPAPWSLSGNTQIKWTWQYDAILPTQEFWAEPIPPLAVGTTAITTVEIWFIPTE
jgi:hypothetical protein